MMTRFFMISLLPGGLDALNGPVIVAPPGS